MLRCGCAIEAQIEAQAVHRWCAVWCSYCCSCSPLVCKTGSPDHNDAHTHTHNHLAAECRLCRSAGRSCGRKVARATCTIAVKTHTHQHTLSKGGAGTRGQAGQATNSSCKERQLNLSAVCTSNQAPATREKSIFVCTFFYHAQVRASAQTISTQHFKRLSGSHF